MENISNQGREGEKGRMEEGKKVHNKSLDNYQNKEIK